MSPESGQFVAAVYVENGKVVIEANAPRLAQELHAVIDPGAYERGFRHIITPHESGSFETARDPKFLEAITEQTGLWMMGRTYDRWTIDGVMSKSEAPCGWTIGCNGLRCQWHGVGLEIHRTVSELLRGRFWRRLLQASLLS